MFDMCCNCALLLFVVCCLMCVVCGLLFDGLFVMCCLLLCVVYCVVCVACCLVFAR